MRLAELAYECVKDAIGTSEGITFDGFVAGDYDSDREFAMQISSAFSCINLAFARLVTGRKIPYRLDECVVSDGKVPFSKGRILNVVDRLGEGYVRLPFRTTGNANDVVITDDVAARLAKVFVEYEPSIPHFTIDSIRKASYDGIGEPETVEERIDLEALYGIDGQMCEYVKEYCKGAMVEYVSPDSSKWHTQLAERYFSELENRGTQFYQQSVRNKHGRYMP